MSQQSRYQKERVDITKPVQIGYHLKTLFFLSHQKMLTVQVVEFKKKPLSNKARGQLGVRVIL